MRQRWREETPSGEEERERMQGSGTVDAAYTYSIEREKRVRSAGKVEVRIK